MWAHHRPLLVIADDYGLAPAVDRAVLASLANGTLSGTAFMPTSPHAEACARALIAQGCSAVSWHLTLSDSSQRPLTGAASGLAGAGGCFVDRNAATLSLTSAGTTQCSDDALRAELSAQLARIESLGLHVTHVSSHHHLHVLPRVAAVLESLLRERALGGIAVRGYGDYLGAPSSGAHRMLSEFARRATSYYRAHDFATTHVVGFRTMAEPTAANLRLELDREDGFEPTTPTPPFREWMVHIADYGAGEAHQSLMRAEEHALLQTRLAQSLARHVSHEQFARMGPALQ